MRIHNKLAEKIRNKDAQVEKLISTLVQKNIITNADATEIKDSTKKVK